MTSAWCYSSQTWPQFNASFHFCTAALVVCKQMCPSNTCIVYMQRKWRHWLTRGLLFFLPGCQTLIRVTAHRTNTSVWRCAFPCSVQMLRLKVRALSECRIKFFVGLLTPERLLLHYKFSKQNTPDGEDFCSGDLLQLSVAQPSLLIKGQKPLVSAPVLVLLHSITRPPGSVGIRGPLRNCVGQWSILTMSHSGSLFLPNWASPLYQPLTSGSAGHTN